MSVIIKHASINWENYIPENAKTLVLGSFNPNNPSFNTDFYYGRETNFFWKAVSDLLGLNQNHFLGSFGRKKEVMDEYKFCFYDLIQQIEVFGEDLPVKQFVNDKVFIEFSDQVLFTTNTNFKGSRIQVKRTYNHQIIDLLTNGNIQTILHTLGNNRIDREFITNPQEMRLGSEGFQQYMNNIANSKANFVPHSYSPSGRAVKVGGAAHYANLKGWIKENLEI